MNIPTIYLAGTMTGLTYAQANLWRLFMARYLSSHGINCLSPTRWHLGMDPKAKFTSTGDSHEELRTLRLNSGDMGDKCMFKQDRQDIISSDLVVACFGIPRLGDELLLDDPVRASIGTTSEVTMAYDYNIPVVGIRPAGAYNHLFIRKMCRYTVPGINDAIHTVVDHFSQEH